MATTFTVLVTVREGRHFHPSNLSGLNLPTTPSNTKLYIQCRFNNEILTTDPTPFSHDPIWDTDLAWDILQKPLAFLKTQRAKLKLVCFAIDSSNKRVQVGYVMLDLRSASSIASPKWNSDPDVDKDAAWGWYPLINTSSNTKKSPASVFRPELRLAFSVVQKISPPAVGTTLNPNWDHVVPAPGKKLQKMGAKKGGKKVPVTKPVVLSSPKAIRVQLFPDSRPTSPVGQIQYNQNQPLFTTTSGIPIELTPTGCYQIGFNGPNWLFNITIAFAENLALLNSTSSQKQNPLSEIAQIDNNAAPASNYFFRYTFLGNQISTTSFPNLANPVFPSERISFRIRASEVDLNQFLKDIEMLVVCLCSADEGETGDEAGTVIGFTEVPIGQVLDAHGDDSDVLSGEDAGDGIGVVEALVGGGFDHPKEGHHIILSRAQSPAVDEFRSSTNNMRRNRSPRVFEKVVTFYDSKQELPVSVDGRVAGLGVSVVVMPDLQADHVELESGGPQKALLGELPETQKYDEPFDEMEDDSANVIQRRAISPYQLDDNIINPSTSLVDSSAPPQISPTKSQQAPQTRASSNVYPQIPSMIPTELPQQPEHQTQQPPLPPTVLPKPDPWHQYRFSIDLPNLRGLDPSHGPVYLKYSYPPFGTTTPITTNPPVKPIVPVVNGGAQKHAITFPHAFSAFEFVMSSNRLRTYLEAVPLSVEVWVVDRYEKDVQIGVASVDLAGVLSGDVRELDAGVVLRSWESIVGVVALKSGQDGDGASGSGAGDLKDRIVRVAELRVVVALEDFGCVDDNVLVEDPASAWSTVGSVSGNLGISGLQSSTAQPQSMPVHGEFDSNRRGPSPTFTKVYRSHLHQDSQPPPTSPTPSSIHETQEYRAALEVALWKKSEMQKFKTHLESLQKHAVEKLSAEFQRRETQRVELLNIRVKELETLEKDTRDVLRKLEEREDAVKHGEEDLERRRTEVESHFKRKDDETSDIARRLGEEFRARVEVERVKALESEAGRVRAVRERDQVEEKLKRLEQDFDIFRKNVMEGKVSGLGVTPAEVGEAAVAAIKTELANVVAQSAATERRAEALDASKKHYKAQWIRTLRDLAKTKKSLQDEIADRLRRSQKELDAVKLRLVAKDEMGVIESDRKILDSMRREIENLKAGSSQQNTISATATGESRILGDSGTGAGVGSGGNDIKEKSVLKNSQRSNQVISEIKRLENEKESLVSTGIYTNDDRLVRELDSRIRRLKGVL